MRISDWSSDVCSSDLPARSDDRPLSAARGPAEFDNPRRAPALKTVARVRERPVADRKRSRQSARQVTRFAAPAPRSEEHTSELQSLMRISYAVFCLKKKNTENKEPHNQ